MLKKLISICCAALILTGTLAGCKGENNVESGVSTQDFPVTIGEVTIGAEPAGVAVLSPNLAQAVLALNYELLLKSKCEECTDEELAPLPNVSLADAAGIKATGADLVLTDSPLSKEEQEAFAKEGLTALALPPASSREDLTRLYTQLGSALKGGKTGYARGEKIAKDIFMTIDNVSRVIPSSDIPITACYLLDFYGGAVTGDSLQGRLIEYAGLLNAGTSSTNNKLPLEEVMLANPQFIFCPVGMKAALEITESYKELDAVKEGRVYEFNPSDILYQGRGMIQAVSFMAGTAYPQLWEGTDVSSAPAVSAPSSEAPVNPSSEAPSSEAPSSEAPSSEAPASTAPASEAPASEAPASQAPSTGGLKPGDNNDEVKRMQKRLQDLKYLYMAASGLYGDGTKQAVLSFQKASGLSATGTADQKTLDALYADSAKTNPTPGQ